MSSEARIISETARWLRHKTAGLRQSGELSGGVVGAADLAEIEAAVQRLESAGAKLLQQSATNPLRPGAENVVANLSHELRTPLTPALLLISAMQANPRLAEDIRSDLATVREQIELEVRLVDALLDTTQLGRGELRLRMGMVDMRSLLRSAISAAQSLAEQGPPLSLEFNAAGNIVRGDAARLAQVFSNLLNNAVKFTPPHGLIKVIAADEGESLLVSVIDTGRGFDPVDTTRLFGAFEQEINPMRDGRSGLGVGLSIAQGLVSLHGGELSGHSDGEGRGATFTVKLPATQPAAPVAPAGPSAVHPAAPPVGHRHRRSLRILLVEDHGQSLLATARLIRSMGHAVRTASGVGTASSLLNSETFDLLIADIELPDGTGWELMRMARAAGPIAGMALSGHGGDDDIAKSQDAGFAQHLVKPITFQRLADAIDEAAPSRTVAL
jgi:signal transduction histidine kinase/ActR/RegA family two-component response regulator